MKVLLLCAAVVLFYAKVSLADHNFPNGSVGALHAESQELDREVQNSGLAYHVKDAVAIFHGKVCRLRSCVENNRQWDHIGDVGVPYECNYDLQRVHSSFRVADRYLYDTDDDYPHVYHVYLDVRASLYAIQVKNPGQAYMCIAVDRGHEEHASGHMGHGNCLEMAQQEAMQNCLRFHGSCRIRRCYRMR